MTPRGWRAPPELAAKIAVLAEKTKSCNRCGAAPGEPCTDLDPGRTVHGNRWVAAMVTYKRELRAARRTASTTERTTKQ